MPVFQWRQNWDHFRDLEREVDRLLQSIKLPFHNLRFQRRFPAVNFYELESEYLLVAELPGIVAQDVELTVAGGMLTLSGDRVGTADVSEEAYRRRERPHGPWQRSLSLPERVREEQVTAEFSNGVLLVHLPKAEDVKPRQIQVTTNNE